MRHSMACTEPESCSCPPFLPRILLQMYITSFVVAKLSVLSPRPIFDIHYLDTAFTQLRFILGGSDDFEPDKSIGLRILRRGEKID